MLNGEWGFLNNVLYGLFHIEGPYWLNDRWSALGAVIVAHIWKWTPFWTLILLAGRMAIPLEIRDTAKVDGATGLSGFVHITFPLLANLYLICTLLSTIFLLGDFNAVTFVSGGGPANSTHVLATLGIRNAFEIAHPRLGVAAVMSALPLVIPLVIVLMRKLRTAEVQLSACSRSTLPWPRHGARYRHTAPGGSGDTRRPRGRSRCRRCSRCGPSCPYTLSG